jgi:anti-anti-sigma factor
MSRNVKLRSHLPLTPRDFNDYFVKIRDKIMAFSTNLQISNNIAQITLSGELDASTAPLFKQEVEEAATQNLKRLVLFIHDLKYLSSAGLRVLIFAKQKMGAKVDIYIVGAQEMVQETIENTGFHHSVFMLNEYNAAEIEHV